jgi:tetratricopeptide (TPR) repeat protein
MATDTITLVRDGHAETPSIAPIGAGPSDDLARAAVLIAAGESDDARLLLRALPGKAVSRTAAVASTLAATALDPEFLSLVARADAARDARDFAQGEFLYWSALNLYPLHCGYITQYAHCLKEQGKWVEAEANYRSALALGGPAADLHRHITACALARGAPACLPAEAPQPTDPIDLPPTLRDVTAMQALVLHRPPTGPEETLALLRDCPRRRDVALALVAMPEFTRANPDLMTLVAGER